MEEFLKFISEIFDVDVNELSLDTSYQSIPVWDSLMHLRLVLEIEEKYNVEIPIDEVPAIVKLADFYRYIEKNNRED